MCLGQENWDIEAQLLWWISPSSSLWWWWWLTRGQMAFIEGKSRTQGSKPTTISRPPEHFFISSSSSSQPSSSKQLSPQPSSSSSLLLDCLGSSLDDKIRPLYWNRALAGWPLTLRLFLRLAAKVVACSLDLEWWWWRWWWYDDGCSKDGKDDDDDADDDATSSSSPSLSDHPNPLSSRRSSLNPVVKCGDRGDDEENEENDDYNDTN